MNKLPNNFGIVTTVCPKDVMMAHATLASIRNYYPEIPICVIVDGNLNDKIFSELYGAITIRADDKLLGEIGTFCSGSPRSKMIAHWCGPFDYYLYLDSDAIFWGEVLSEIHWNGEDFIILWPPMKEKAHKSWMKEFYFNVDLIKEYDSEFEWEYNNYFSAGVYFSRKNIFSFEEWKHIEGLRCRAKNIFSWTTDQGVLNYFVFSKNQKGKIILGERDLQWIPDHRKYETTYLMYPCKGQVIPKNIANPTILHFAGHKPLLIGRGAMNHFTAMRLLAARKYRNKGLIGSWVTLIGEDAVYNYGKIKKKIKKIFGYKSNKSAGALSRVSAF